MTAPKSAVVPAGAYNVKFFASVPLDDSALRGLTLTVALFQPTGSLYSLPLGMRTISVSGAYPGVTCNVSLTVTLGGAAISQSYHLISELQNSVTLSGFVKPGTYNFSFVPVRDCGLDLSALNSLSTTKAMARPAIVGNRVVSLYSSGSFSVQDLDPDCTDYTLLITNSNGTVVRNSTSAIWSAFDYPVGTYRWVVHLPL